MPQFFLASNAIQNMMDLKVRRRNRYVRISLVFQRIFEWYWNVVRTRSLSDNASTEITLPNVTLPFESSIILELVM